MDKDKQFVLRTNKEPGLYRCDGFYKGSSYVFQGSRYANVVMDISLAKKYKTRRTAEIAAKMNFENYLFVIEEV